jgi:PAS domain S-box-containing protein
VDLQAAGVLRVHNDLLTFREAIQNAVDVRDAERLAAELRPLRQAFLADLDRAREALASSAADARRHAVMLIVLETIRTALPAQASSMGELASAGDWDAVRLRLENQLSPLTRSAERLVREIDAEVTIERSQTLEEIGRAQRRAVWTLLATGLLTLVCAAALGLGVTRSIARPLNRLDEGVRALARGEFQHQVPVTGHDEMAGLARVFNDMAARLRDLYETVRKSEAHFRSLIENASDLIVVLNAEGTIVYASPSSGRVIGYTPEALMGRHALELVHPEDAPAARTVFGRRDAPNAPARSLEVRFRHADGSWRVLEAVARSLLEDPAVQGIVLNARDVTEDRRAAERIQASLREKELLLQEIHHRVKNNLQVISSLLNLQSRHIQDPAILEILKESHNRVRSMALVHETLYQSGDLGRINVGEYVRRLATHLFSSYGVSPSLVRLAIQIEDVEFGIDTAIPCGLFINELVSNALKHAFPGRRRGEICIELRREEDGPFLLKVSDDGVGLPPELDYQNTASLGLQLVTTLAAQLEGTLEYAGGSGTTFQLRFREVGSRERVADG